MTGMIGSRIPALCFFAFLLACSAWLPAQAAEPFTIEDIRIDGLQRVAPGTVFNYLPVKTGDYLDAGAARNAIQTLFKTGLFNDVSLAKDGGVLVVNVVERPTIAKITLTGNSEMETEQLLTSLKGIGFAEGRVFDRSLLDKVQLELQRQYFSLGHYAVRIEDTVTPQVRNRVNIQIEVSEGKKATIRQINLIGNKVFSDSELLDEFQLTPTAWYLFFSERDQYSKQKLGADLESLRSFYLDRGYLNFDVNSTQVSISPDKEAVYISIGLSEGRQYEIEDVKLLGNLILPREKVEKALQIKAGEVFSRKKVTASSEQISNLIGSEGYIFAKVNPAPDIDPETGKVILNFFIDPGQRVYVRRINFSGNTRTRDEVLRREMRQMEGGWASTEQIQRSRLRLQRLRFFEMVEVENEPVPGTADQVDVNYTVKELAGGNLMAGLGFSQTEGFLLNASISQDNFLGSGNHVSLAFNNSSVNRVYSFSFTQPYFTIDGVSQSFGAYYRETDAAEANLSRYALDTIGANLVYGVPINEHDRYRFGFEPEQVKVKTTDSSAPEISDYIDRYGDTFLNYKLIGGWSHDTRNNALFPDRGVLQSLTAEISLPFSDMDYYKINYRHNWYLPLASSLTLALKADIAYGKTYDDTEFPFFENYIAGGPRSVRGFKENTLGPRDSVGNPVGGNMKVIGNVELITPMPFIRDSNALRLSAFFDIGNVYGVEEDFEVDELRYSTGVALIWLSPMGALNFSVGQALNDKEGDSTQMFQFSLGTTF